MIIAENSQTSLVPG